MALHPDPANWPAALVAALEQGLGLPLSGQGTAAQELREVLQAFDGDMWRDLRQETGGSLTLAAQARLKVWLANKDKPLPVFASVPNPPSTEGNAVVITAMKQQPAPVHLEGALLAMPTPARSMAASDSSGMVDLPALAMTGSQVRAHAAAEQAAAKQGRPQIFVWRVSPDGKLVRSSMPASKLSVAATSKKLAEELCCGDFGANMQQLQGKRLAEHDCTVAVAALQHGAGCLLSILPGELAALQLEENHLARAMAQGEPRILGQALLVRCWPSASGQMHFGPMHKEACQDAVDAGRRSTATKSGGKKSDVKGKEESCAEVVRLDERRKEQIKAILYRSQREATPAPPGKVRLPAKVNAQEAPVAMPPCCTVFEWPKADDAVALGKRARVASPQEEAAASEEEDDDWGPCWRAAVEKPVKKRREGCEEASQSALESAAFEAKEAASPCSDGAAAPSGAEECLEQLVIEGKASAEQGEACASPWAGADEQCKKQLLARARRVAHGCA